MRLVALGERAAKKRVARVVRAAAQQLAAGGRARIRAHAARHDGPQRAQRAGQLDRRRVGL
eukprot:27254-Prymnesium_polylepis.1